MLSLILLLFFATVEVVVVAVVADFVLLSAATKSQFRNGLMLSDEKETDVF